MKCRHLCTCSLIKLLITLRLQLQIKKVRVQLKYVEATGQMRHFIDVWMKVHNNVNLVWTLLQIASITLKHKLKTYLLYLLVPSDNLKMVAADKTDTFQLKYCSCGVKQHQRTLYPHATLQKFNQRTGTQVPALHLIVACSYIVNKWC
jgi:hypothetical protein